MVIYLLNYLEPKHLTQGFVWRFLALSTLTPKFSRDIKLLIIETHVTNVDVAIYSHLTLTQPFTLGFKLLIIKTHVTCVVVGIYGLRTLTDLRGPSL